MVAHRGKSALARKLIEQGCEKQGIQQDQLIIHSDRGPNMTSKSALLLADLGVTKSHSRPCVSNQQARELTKQLQGYIDRMNINVAFSTYGEKNKNISVIVSEKETGKLIRKIPPEELQRLHVKMEDLTGMLFNGMA